MTETFPYLTDDLKLISECSLYRDPRVSKRARLHTFCGECKETATINQKSCPLCRPFFGVPEDGCGSIPKNYIEEKLVDLHQEYLEKKLNLKNEKIIDIPLIEQFYVNGMGFASTHMSWMENKIYVLYYHSSKLQVFNDQAPFDELLQSTYIPGLGRALSMIASAFSRSIFITDEFGYIYKIQTPNGEISQWESFSLDGRSGLTTRMSNSMVSGNCLVASFMNNWDDVESIQYELQLLTQLDGDLRRNSVIPLPKEMKYVGHVVHSSDNHFIISYSKTYPSTQCWISMLSDDGKMIKTFYPKLESVLKNPGVCPFDIDDNGHIFVADTYGDNVIWLNSNFTDYRIILRENHEKESPCNIVYIPEKRQLLVQERKRISPVACRYSIYVYHLSPCNFLGHQRK